MPGIVDRTFFEAPYKAKQNIFNLTYVHVFDHSYIIQTLIYGVHNLYITCKEYEVNLINLQVNSFFPASLDDELLLIVKTSNGAEND